MVAFDLSVAAFRNPNVSLLGSMSGDYALGTVTVERIAREHFSSGQLSKAEVVALAERFRSCESAVEVFSLANAVFPASKVRDVAVNLYRERLTREQSLVEEFYAWVNDKFDTFPYVGENFQMLAEANVSSDEHLLGEIRMGIFPNVRCYDSFEDFCAVVCGIHDSETAREIVEHEGAHATVLQKHGVEHSFNLTITRPKENPDRLVIVKPSIEPIFPASMTLDVRRRIFAEVVEAPEEPSDADLAAADYLKRETGGAL